MPVYDCGAPDCEECQRAFGPDRSKAIESYTMREVAYSHTYDPRDPDPSRPGIFRNHNCAYCSDGKKPCRQGNPTRCEYPHARND